VRYKGAVPRQGLVQPDLDRWLAAPALRVRHQRECEAGADELWAAARELRLADAPLLGRVIRWRIPGLHSGLRFDELFRRPPFVVLHEDERALVSGLVGRIWVPWRDYTTLRSPAEFEAWTQPGTARVVFANWAQERGDGRALLSSETRAQALGAQGRLGIAAVRPLVLAFEQLIGSEAIAAAVRRADERD
jgi:hypothetical protein